MSDLFLDSSVFFSFVGPARLEPFHGQSVLCFNSETDQRFSGIVVRQEVEARVKTRKRLYTALLRHVQSGGRMGEFPVDEYSRHDAERARALVNELRGNDADLEYLRQILIDVDARVRHAFGRVAIPLAPHCGDAYFEDTLRASIGIQLGDAKITTDYMYWASQRENPSTFVSGDRELIRGLLGLGGELLGEKFGAHARNFVFQELKDFGR